MPVIQIKVVFLPFSQTLPGNWNYYQVKRNVFHYAFTAKHLRILPMGWNTENGGKIGVRLEVYGCPYGKVLHIHITWLSVIQTYFQTHLISVPVVVSFGKPLNMAVSILKGLKKQTTFSYFAFS